MQNGFSEDDDENTNNITPFDNLKRRKKRSLISCDISSLEYKRSKSDIVTFPTDHISVEVNVLYTQQILKYEISQTSSVSDLKKMIFKTTKIKMQDQILLLYPRKILDGASGDTLSSILPNSTYVKLFLCRKQKKILAPTETNNYPLTSKKLIKILKNVSVKSISHPIDELCVSMSKSTIQDDIISFKCPEEKIISRCKYCNIKLPTVKFHCSKCLMHFCCNHRHHEKHSK